LQTNALVFIVIIHMVCYITILPRI